MARAGSLLRNLGIIAHIDAGNLNNLGKTSTTERMLYYVGYTDRIGNVDSGTTVTDYLQTERNRGITITAACVPLAWREHRLNLIDTPGHVDFTIEVERSLRVLDGAVAVLDGVAGVQAQTTTVWAQANRHRIPRIAFINKMDRPGASLPKTLESMRSKLLDWGEHMLCQLPLFDRSAESSISNAEPNLTTSNASGGKLAAIIDLVTMEKVTFNAVATGRIVTRAHLQTTDSYYADALTARETLIEKLVVGDPLVEDIYLECDLDAAAFPASALIDSLRRATINGIAVPVLVGSALRNLGIQPLLDAIIDYLPEPSSTVATIDGIDTDVQVDDPKLIAYAFKVIYDLHRGPVVFVRVYSGTLDRRSALCVATSGPRVKESVGRLLELYAGDYQEINEITSGGIGAIVGLKHVKTGDTLVEMGDSRVISCQSIQIPAPVFVRSCDPVSSSDEKSLDVALANLMREDPSLSVQHDAETGQRLLYGMGELHLEIAGERLLETYRVKCKLGKVAISYHETITEPAFHALEYDTNFLGKHLQCTVSIQVSVADPQLAGSGITITMPESEECGHGKGIKLDISEIHQAAHDGISGSLSNGPLLGFPITHLNVAVLSIQSVSTETFSIPAIRAATRQCLSECLAGKTRLLEPVMSLVVKVPNEHVGAVNRDMGGQRRGQVLGVESSGPNTLIACRAPLKELVGYASKLRSMTAGTGEWTMEIDGYQLVPPTLQDSVIADIRGY